jgi:hypothetical protein
MVGTCRPLLEVLADVPDVRGRRGKRHPLPALLALACAATLCGARGYTTIAEWGRNADPALMRGLGFTHRTMPCAATFFLVFSRMDWVRLEAALGGWVEEVLRALPAPAGEVEAIAVDGKTLRGSRKLGAPAVHVLSAVSHRLGLTLGQQAVDDRTNEIPVTPLLLRGLVLEGRVVTTDALLTQREIAQTVLAGGGDYVMVVKGNQPQMERDIAEVFGSPPPAATRRGRRPPPGTAAMDGESGGGSA